MANDLALHSMAFYIDPILLVTLLKGLSITSQLTSGRYHANKENKVG